jgi:hypothetical protein
VASRWTGIPSTRSRPPATSTTALLLPGLNPPGFEPVFPA